MITYFKRCKQELRCPPDEPLLLLTHVVLYLANTRADVLKSGTSCKPAGLDRIYMPELDKRGSIDTL